MFILLRVSWSHSRCFYSWRSTTKYLWTNFCLFLSVSQSVGKCLICNKDIRANDASSLRDDGWKTLTDLANTWGSVVLPIDHQYEEYPQVHELMGDRKTLFYKQYRSRNCHPPFGRHLLINQLKKAIKDDKAGRKLQEHRRPFYRMHLCWTWDPVQPQVNPCLCYLINHKTFTFL